MENQESDGLSDFNIEQTGQRTGAFGGARMLKYVTDHYVTREGEIVEPNRELVCLGLKKLIQKFVDKKLVDTIVVADGEKVPDVKAMNEAAPREEWGVDLNGNPVGPYMFVLVLKLLDAENMDRFAFVTSSVGGSIAVGDLSDKCKIMRRLKDPSVVPVISCSTTNFKTRYCTRKRPDFRVLRWITLGGGNGQLPPPTEQKTIAAPAAAPKKTSSTIGKATFSSFGKPVEEPTLKEEMDGDEIPF